MLIQPTSQFDEGQLAAMNQALDLAWETLGFAIRADEEEAPGARELLAALIRELASQGETSPKALRDYALRRFVPVLPHYLGRLQH